MKYYNKNDIIKQFTQSVYALFEFFSGQKSTLSPFYDILMNFSLLQMFYTFLNLLGSQVPFDPPPESAKPSLVDCQRLIRLNTISRLGTRPLLNEISYSSSQKR